MSIRGILISLGFLAMGILIAWLGWGMPVPAIAGVARVLFFAWCVVAGVIGLLIFAILRALPVRPALSRTSHKSVTADAWHQVTQLEQQGFLKIIGPATVNTGPPSVMVPMLLADGTAYGTVYFPLAQPSKVGNDIVSVLQRSDGEKVFLTTGNLAEGGTMPPPPGSFMQLFPDADAATLLRHHREALRLLAGNRHQPIKLEEKQFAAVVRNFLNASRQTYLANPVGLTVPALWTTLTGHSARLGPISEQSAVVGRLGSG